MGPIDDPNACRLAAGDLEAVFLPGYGMLGASLRHRGVELLRRVDDLEAAAAKGSTAGIPLLHPWANRLPGLTYRVGSREVSLDPSSPILHFDEHGLPIHGVPWSRLSWQVTGVNPDSIAARLEWSRGDLLTIFPFPHRLELVATLRPDALTIETTLTAAPEHPVPVSFGFHPYVGLPGLPRVQWRLHLPAMRRFRLDKQGVPTGEEEVFDGLDSLLGDMALDNGFALGDGPASFGIVGAGRRIAVEFLYGYRYAQVFAPRGKDYIALEPMTAPTAALASGRGLLLASGGTYRAAFRIAVERIQ